MAGISPRDLSILQEPESDPSFWDCLFRLGGGPEAALLYAKAFWPELLELEGFVLLSENYDPEYFARSIQEYGPSNLEATINTTYLDSVFGAAETKPEVIEELGRMICESWEARAKMLFPARHFVAHFGWYSSDGDAGVVLHQLKWPCSKCRQEGIHGPGRGTSTGSAPSSVTQLNARTGSATTRTRGSSCSHSGERMTVCYLFTSPPAGKVYCELVRFGCALATEALLVVRDPDIEPEGAIADKLLALIPFLKDSSRVQEWPGTRLLYDDANVAMLYRYQTSAELAQALVSMRPALLDWLHPEAPEDLCFIRADGSPILVTISHEKDAYLLLTKDEKSQLDESSPELAATLTPETS
jgi:hypothetical protein